MSRQRRVIIGVAIAVLALFAVVLCGALVPGAAPKASAADPVVLTVKHDGTLVKTYTMAELQAVTPYAGYAGLITSGGTVSGPAAVTGVQAGRRPAWTHPRVPADDRKRLMSRNAQRTRHEGPFPE